MTEPTTNLPQWHDYGAGPVRVWYDFTTEWSAPSPDHWRPIIRCMAGSPAHAVERARRAFPEDTSGALVRITAGPAYGPLTRPAED